MQNSFSSWQRPLGKLGTLYSAASRLFCCQSVAREIFKVLLQYVYLSSNCHIRHESSDCSERGGAELSRIYLCNPKILSLSKEKQPTQKGKQQKGGTSSSWQENAEVAAEFADERRPISAPSLSFFCLFEGKHQHVALQSKYRNEFIPQSSRSSAPTRPRRSVP